MAASAIAFAVPVVGCGGSDSKENSSNQQAGGNGQGDAGQQGGRPPGPGAMAQDPKLASCLRKQGVRLPSRNRPPGQGQGTAPQGPPDGQAPGGRPPAGGAPPNGGRPRDSGQFKKMQRALKKCGVQMPAPPQGGQGGAPPATEQQNFNPSSGRVSPA